MMLLLKEKLADRIRAHAALIYPNECCGALLGIDREGVREVVELHPLVNRRQDSPRNRFSISVEDVRAADQAARNRNLDLVGWYHSHPDHPALPSEYDREHAWPWYSYVIVSVNRHLPEEMTSWRLSDDRARFAQEQISDAAPAQTSSAPARQSM